HPDPESCVGGRKGAGEALTGAHVGQPSSCEIRSSGVPTRLSDAEGYTEGDVIGEQNATQGSCTTSRIMPSILPRPNFGLSNHDTCIKITYMGSDKLPAHGGLLVSAGGHPCLARRVDFPDPAPWLASRRHRITAEAQSRLAGRAAERHPVESKNMG